MHHAYEPPYKIKLITFNCWGLKFIAKHRHARLCRIGDELVAAAKETPSIVGLQECWTMQDYLAIRHRTRYVLPYSKFYFSGIFGAGLAILSAYPIVRSSMHAYPLNGRPTAFFRGDWFVGKGVACARIRVPTPSSSGTMGKGENGIDGSTSNGDHEIIDVFCTHLHAPYEREPNDSYVCHRTAQAWEIAKLMNDASERGHLTVGLGDFNMLPGSLAHDIIEAHAPVQDIWRVAYPDSSLGAAEDSVEKARGRPQPSVEYNISHNGTTCDSASNTWRWDKPRQKKLDKGEDIEADMKSDDPRGKRLDYVFVGNGMRSRHDPWFLESVSVGMTGRHPELGCSLSDHYSVEAFLLRGNDAAKDQSHRQSTIQSDAAAKASKIMTLSSQHDGPLPGQTYQEILAMINKYEARERKQRRLRLAHFGISFFVSIGCLIAVWWSPRNFVSFLLMLLSTIGLAAGVIDGLIGGLFVSSEIRTLKEFRWEIGNANAITEQRKVRME